MQRTQWLRVVWLMAVAHVASACTAVSSEGGAEVVRHLGYTKLIVAPVSKTAAELGALQPRASPGTFASWTVVGAWLGDSSGVGVRRETRVVLRADCQVAVFARNADELERFVALLNIHGLKGQNVCVAPSPL